MSTSSRRTGKLWLSSFRSWIAGAVLALVLFAPDALGAPAAGDLDGNGSVGASDEALLAPLYGQIDGGALYDPAADLDGDGTIGLRDLARFGALFGNTGDVDQTPPTISISLDDIPDDMNDVLVAPPGGFQITVHFDSGGGSLVRPETLEAYSLLDLGPYAKLSNLGPMFESTPTRAVLEIPPSPSIARTTHLVFAGVSDRAGNGQFAVFAFGVRDFVLGAPMGTLQTIFLDFDQNRSLGPDIDFLESLREFGLSSATAPAIEAQVRNLIVAEIVSRTQAYFESIGSLPGDAPVNIQFQSSLPGVPHSRLCVGGESSAGSIFLGAAPLDMHNAAKTSDDCSLSPQFGVFPHAIDNLWGGSADFQAAFDGVDPGLGGVPVGEDPLDVTILDPGFHVATASSAQLDRLLAIVDAVDAFSQTIATAIAHETGHMLGLTAPGPTPAGLYGGASGNAKDHNVTVAGTTPSQNYLMNPGGSFSFAEISGRGADLPVFRPLSWAYLHDRIALNSQVTGLYLAPTLQSIDPGSVSFGGGYQANFELLGANFTPTIGVKLLNGGPIPYSVSSAVVAAGGASATATISSFLVPPGTYDVQLTNADGQQATLLAALQVTP